jgi:uncharacterized protein
MIVRLVVLLIRGYQVTIAPLLVDRTYNMPRCRFSPSCSQYAVDALTTQGLVRGSWLTLRRLLRCHPWNPGGYDPVPPTLAVSTSAPSESAQRSAVPTS